MLTQFHPEDFDFEELIFEINNNTQTNYNENLERQYNDLNAVELYIVDHSKEFEIGFGRLQYLKIPGYLQGRLQYLKIPGYLQKGIAKIFNKYCNSKRIHKNSKEAKEIQDFIQEENDAYYQYVEDENRSGSYPIKQGNPYYNCYISQSLS